MSDPSGCITYKLAVLRGPSQSANLPYNRVFGTRTGRITALAQIFSFFHRKTKNLCVLCTAWLCMLCSPLISMAPLCPFAAFIKERKMGLNDFIQKLVSTPHICQQWVFPFKLYFVGMKIWPENDNYAQEAYLGWSLADFMIIGQSN